MDRASNAVSAAGHKINETVASASKEANKQSAMNSNAPISERASAAWDATKDKATEIKEGAAKNVDKKAAGL